jgi:hypothetical protein
LDLLAASFTTSSVDVLLAQGTTYGPPAGLGVGFRVRRIQSGDLDGDGVVELVTANFEETALSIVERDSDGVAVAPSTYPAGHFPFYFATADFVAPKGPEIATAIYDEGKIAFQRVTKAGALEAAGDVLIPGPFRPTFVVAFDADDDGDPDLAVTDGEGLSIAIVFNDGVLPFTRVEKLATAGFQILGAAAGDLDDDGDEDLVAAAQGNDLLVVLRNDGGGVFTELAPIALGRNPAEVVLADFDGDRDLDVAVTEVGDDTVSLLANDGNLGLTFRARSATGDGPTFLVAGDLDGDRRVDLCVACPVTDSITRLRNQGGFTFARSELFVGRSANFIQLVDVDRDGDLDLIAIPTTGDGLWFLNDSIGNLVPNNLLDFLTVRDVSLAAVLDLNGDRVLDLLAASNVSTRLAVGLGAVVPRESR